MRSRSQARREAAYVEFVTARQTELRRLAYAVCGDWHQAEEILHSALTKLYVAWPRQQREGTEEAFVRRLVVRAHVGTEVRPADPGDPPRDPLVDALLSLAPKQRRIVLLRGWLGLSDEETAEELGLSVSSVRAHAARAERSMPALPAQETR